VNVGGSYNVFEACLEHNVKKVVYASTSSIYGNPKRLPVQENDEKRFLNFYSASKYSAEIYAKTFHEVFDLPVTILRYSNIYGPYQTPANPYCGVIGKFITAALEGTPLMVHGDGRQTRDYTYIDDAVEATIAAAVYPQTTGQDYNIATGIQTSVLDLANAIIRITQSSSPIEHVENRDIDNIRFRCIDVEKSKKDLHYQPEYQIEKGLQSTVNWFVQSLAKVSAGSFAVANVLVA
jgi:UDP-glucose 4-epimerase